MGTAMLLMPSKIDIEDIPISSRINRQQQINSLLSNVFFLAYLKFHCGVALHTTPLELSDAIYVSRKSLRNFPRGYLETENLL